MSASQAFVLGSIPALAMLLFTLLGLRVEVPSNIAGALQHFAAGILICSVSTELLPAMVDASGIQQVVASGIGFFLGVALMIVVGVLFPEEDYDHDDHENEESKEDERDQGTGFSGRRSSSLIKVAYNLPMQERALPTTASESTPLTVGTSQARAFPFALLLTVCVDSIIDGLLIGIATGAGPSAGPMLALSLCVEMSFLGLTLAASMVDQPASHSGFAALLGPAGILLGSICGGTLSAALQHHPAMMVALLSFGVAALLFMVAEELLLEAHEKGEHVWWVDLQLYIGFYVSVLLGKLVSEA